MHVEYTFFLPMREVDLFVHCFVVHVVSILSHMSMAFGFCDLCGIWLLWLWFRFPLASLTCV